MWDQVLNTIDEATTPKKAVEFWGGDSSSLEIVSCGINLVYRFKLNNQDAYLRITHQKLRPVDELNAALQFQKHLSESDVAVCSLIQSINGNDYEQIKQGDETFLAHICAGVPGEPINFDYLDNALYEKWGAELGKLHLAATKFVPQGSDYGRWENDIEELEGYAKTEEANIQTELTTVLATLQNHPQTAQNYGLIHGDHRKGNVLSDGKQVHIIDFDLPRYCWFMDDISRPFFSSLMQGHDNWQSKLAPYLNGYRQAFNLSDRELSMFAWFMRYKALNMYLWTKYNWKSDIAPGGVKTQEWLALLHRMIVDQGWVDELTNLVCQS